jgi:hypothetical protein
MPHGRSWSSILRSYPVSVVPSLAMDGRSAITFPSSLPSPPSFELSSLHDKDSPVAEKWKEIIVGGVPYRRLPEVYLTHSLPATV